MLNQARHHRSTNPLSDRIRDHNLPPAFVPRLRAPADRDAAPLMIAGGEGAICFQHERRPVMLSQSVHVPGLWTLTLDLCCSQQEHGVGAM